MAWINLALGVYALWRAADLKNARASVWSWGSMAVAGAILLIVAGLQFSGHA